jgi:hypothetical protein
LLFIPHKGEGKPEQAFPWGDFIQVLWVAQIIELTSRKSMSMEGFYDWFAF